VVGGGEVVPARVRRQDVEAVFGAVEFLVERNVARDVLEDDGMTAASEDVSFKLDILAIARQPAFPCGLLFQFGRVARVGSVIHVEPRQLVEANGAVQLVAGQGGGEVADKGAIARRDGQPVATEEFNLHVRRLFSLPGAGEEGDFVAAFRAEAGDAEAITLQPAEREIVIEHEAEFHRVGFWRRGIGMVIANCAGGSK
jgi:hypothetical protein